MRKELKEEQKIAKSLSEIMAILKERSKIQHAKALADGEERQRLIDTHVQPPSFVLWEEIDEFEKRRETMLRIIPYGAWIVFHKRVMIGFYLTYGCALVAGYKKAGNVPFLVKQLLKEDKVAVIATPFVQDDAYIGKYMKYPIDHLIKFNTTNTEETEDEPLESLLDPYDMP